MKQYRRGRSLKGLLIDLLIGITYQLLVEVPRDVFILSRRERKRERKRNERIAAFERDFGWPELPGRIGETSTQNPRGDTSLMKAGRATGRSAHRQRQSSFLSRLPAYIRMLIYDMLLIGATDANLCNSNTEPYSAKCYFGSWRPTLSLLRTCRYIYSEALPHYYGSIRFRIHDKRIASFFMTSMPSCNRALIRHLAVSYTPGKLPILDDHQLSDWTAMWRSVALFFPCLSRFDVYLGVQYTLEELMGMHDSYSELRWLLPVMGTEIQAYLKLQPLSCRTGTLDVQKFRTECLPKRAAPGKPLDEADLFDDGEACRDLWAALLGEVRQENSRYNYLKFRSVCIISIVVPVEAEA